MKTIGTCKECKWWKDPRGEMRFCTNGEARFSVNNMTGPDFGCIHWEDKAKPLENYPARTAQDLEIEDLKRENEAAFQRIQELSTELVRLGYDPTAKRQCACGNPSQHITGWDSNECYDCRGIIQTP